MIDTELVKDGVGDRLRKVRQACELTNGQLAKHMGAKQSQISRWESGTVVPSWRSLVKWARATRPDLLSFLFDGSNWYMEEGDKPPPPSQPSQNSPSIQITIEVTNQENTGD